MNERTNERISEWGGTLLVGEEARVAAAYAKVLAGSGKKNQPQRTRARVLAAHTILSHLTHLLSAS